MLKITGVPYKPELRDIEFHTGSLLFFENLNEIWCVASQEILNGAIKLVRVGGYLDSAHDRENWTYKKEFNMKILSKLVDDGRVKIISEAQINIENFVDDPGRR